MPLNSRNVCSLDLVEEGTSSCLRPLGFALREVPQSGVQPQKQCAWGGWGCVSHSSLNQHEAQAWEHSSCLVNRYLRFPGDAVDCTILNHPLWPGYPTTAPALSFCLLPAPQQGSGPKQLQGPTSGCYLIFLLTPLAKTSCKLLPDLSSSLSAKLILANN